MTKPSSMTEIIRDLQNIKCLPGSDNRQLYSYDDLDDLRAKASRVRFSLNTWIYTTPYGIREHLCTVVDGIAKFDALSSLAKGCLARAEKFNSAKSTASGYWTRAAKAARKILGEVEFTPYDRPWDLVLFEMDSFKQLVYCIKEALNAEPADSEMILNEIKHCRWQQDKLAQQQTDALANSRRTLDVCLTSYELTKSYALHKTEEHNIRSRAAREARQRQIDTSPADVIKADNDRNAALNRVHEQMVTCVNKEGRLPRGFLKNTCIAVCANFKREGGKKSGNQIISPLLQANGKEFNPETLQRYYNRKFGSTKLLAKSLRNN